MRRLLIYGYLGGRNFGDELMLLGLLGRYTRADDRIAIITPDGSIPPHLAGRVEKAFPKTPGGYLKGLAWATDFMMCGGTVFHDAYPDDRHAGYRKNLVSVALVLRFARLAGRKVHLCSIGLGPLRRPLTKWTARVALHAASTITLRDVNALADARSIDPALPYELRRDLALEAGLEPAETQQRRGLALSLVSPALVSTTDEAGALTFYHDLARILAAYQARSGESISLLVMCVGAADSDIEFADWFAGIARRAGVTDLAITPFDGDPLKMVAVLQAVRGIISMRFHGATVAEIIHTPTFWLAYQRKVLDGAREHHVPEERVGLPDQPTLERINNWLAGL